MLKVRFAVGLNEKPFLTDYLEAINFGNCNSVPCQIDKIKHLSVEDYDDFVNSLTASYSWLAGTGGLDSESTASAGSLEWYNKRFHRVVEVCCPGRLTLFVDASGLDHAWIVGIE